MSNGKDQNPFSDIPPSPSIEVRTLHSDVQAMSESGGTGMQIEDVQEMIGRKVVPPSPPKTPGEGGSWFFRLAVLVLIVLIAAVIVTFIVGLGNLPPVPLIGNFFQSSSSTTPTTSVSKLYVPASSTATFNPYTAVEDQEFFRISPDATLSLVLSRQAAETTDDLLTYSQKIVSRLAEARSSARFIEIKLLKDNDSLADGLTFMSVTGIQIFDNQTFAQNFLPNVKAFVYRDSRGNWPGYIFKLLPGKSSRSLSSDLQNLERSQYLTALFLSDPGAPRGGFVDNTQSSVATREQAFSLPGAGIGYAWQERYFVVSTSFDGLKEALRRLKG